MCYPQGIRQANGFDARQIIIMDNTLTLPLKPDHIGYAVRDMEKSLGVFSSLGFIPESEILLDEGRHVYVAFLRKDGLRIELLSPADDHSPINSYLNKIGNTPYHICYHTPDLEKTIRELRQLKFIVVEKAGASPAFDGKKVAFLYHIHYGLLELVEE
jgi:methylmalonyl-CoA/ethylmalonyl-CoA epimerase